jgi:hypothetical protein
MKRILDGLGLAVFLCVVCGLGWSAGVMPGSPVAIAGNDEPMDWSIGAAAECVADGGQAYRAHWSDHEARIYQTCTFKECTVWYWDRTVGEVEYCADGVDLLANDWGCEE